METKNTPFGEECIAVDQDSKLGNLITSQARGNWQRAVVSNLCDQGYVIGYLADGKLQGKARQYQSHYSESLKNLMGRISDNLRDNSPYRLISGSVGPNGAFGYYLSE